MEGPEIPRLRLKQLTVVKTVFSIIGEMYNEGYILLDINSHDFLGYLTQDTIVGSFRDDSYYVFYEDVSVDHTNIEPNGIIPIIKKSVILDFEFTPCIDSYEDGKWVFDEKFYLEFCGEVQDLNIQRQVFEQCKYLIRRYT